MIHLTTWLKELDLFVAANHVSLKEAMHKKTVT